MAACTPDLYVEFPELDTRGRVLILHGSNFEDAKLEALILLAEALGLQVTWLEPEHDFES